MPLHSYPHRPLLGRLLHQPQVFAGRAILGLGLLCLSSAWNGAAMAAAAESGESGNVFPQGRFDAMNVGPADMKQGTGSKQGADPGNWARLSDLLARAGWRLEKSWTLKEHPEYKLYASLTNRDAKATVVARTRLSLQPDWKRLVVQTYLAGRNLQPAPSLTKSAPSSAKAASSPPKLVRQQSGGLPLGKRETSLAAVRLSFENSRHRRIGAYIDTLSLKRASSFRLMEKVLDVPAGAAYLCVEPTLAAYTGELCVDDIAVWDGSEGAGVNPSVLARRAGLQQATSANRFGKATTSASRFGKATTAASRFGKATTRFAERPSPFGKAASPSEESDLLSPASVVSQLNKEHPRLLLDARQFAALTRQVHSSPVLKPWYQQLRAEAQSLLSKPPSTYEIPDGLRLLTTCRQVQRRVYTLAFVYQIERDPRYSQRAWQELEAAAKFPDWNPRHFLDTAEMTHAFAIGYDWLYAVWTPEQRQLLRSAMVEKGLKPALACYRGRHAWAWWVQATHNWNHVCNGGIGLGALALGDVEPQICEEILQEALRSLPPALQQFNPDGGSAEGPTYWDYAMSYTVLFLAALESSANKDFGLTGHFDVARSGLFPVALKGPTGRAFNFADGGERAWGISAMFWLARKSDRPSVALHRSRFLNLPSSLAHALDIVWSAPLPFLPRLAGPVSAAQAKATSPEATQKRAVELDPADGIPPAIAAAGSAGGAAQAGKAPAAGKAAGADNATVTPVPAIVASPDNLPLSSYFRGAEVVTMRSAWDDPQAVFVGFKAGDNAANHAHLDLGSFVLDALGQRWAIDLGTEDYNLPGYFEAARGQYYRVRAEGHNTLVVNPDKGVDQIPALCRIVRYEATAQRTYAVADLSAAYQRAGAQVQRGVALLNSRQVLVQDEIDATRPSEVWWFLHTRAAVQVSPDGKTATLSQGGKRLQARVLAPEGAVFSVREAQPLPASPNPPGQDRNAGVRKLAVHLTGIQNSRLAVLLSPLQGEEAVTVPALSSLAEW